jgi:hypothetical protein
VSCGQLSDILGGEAATVALTRTAYSQVASRPEATRLASTDRLATITALIIGFLTGRAWNFPPLDKIGATVIILSESA